MKEIRDFFKRRIFEIPAAYGSEPFTYVELLPSLFICACLAQSHSYADVELVAPFFGGSTSSKLRAHVVVIPYEGSPAAFHQDADDEEGIELDYDEHFGDWNEEYGDDFVELPV